MKTVLYVYSKCSTCQEAMRFLTVNHIAFEKREITETPPSVTELKQMLCYVKNDVKKLFNSSGMLYREMQLSNRLFDMPLKDSLELLSSHGMLVKRPFLLAKNVGLLGFRENDWHRQLVLRSS